LPTHLLPLTIYCSRSGATPCPQASSSSSSDDEEGDPVRRRRTILQPKRGFDGLPDATAAAHGPPPSTLFFSWRASAAGPCRAQASSTSTAFDPSLHHTQLRALHTSNFQHYAGPSDSRRGPAGADPGVGAGTTKPTSDMLAGNLIFAKESFLKYVLEGGGAQQLVNCCCFQWRQLWWWCL